MRPLHDAPAMRPRRRQLRARATPSERRLWALLQHRRAGGLRFRRQHSIGRYVVDFYCAALRLAVELDGPIHRRPEVAAYDAERTAWLHAHGIRVLRLPNSALLRDPHAAVAWIVAHAHPLARPDTFAPT